MSAPIRSPRTETIAYRIWGYAKPIGWDCTSTDIADALDLTAASVRRVIHLKGWGNRVRCNVKSKPIKPASGFDGVSAGVWI